MNRLPLRISWLAVLALSTGACSVIVSGKLSDKPAGTDGGTGCTSGNPCNPGPCKGPGVCNATGACIPSEGPAPDDSTCDTDGVADNEICTAGMCHLRVVDPTCPAGATDGAPCEHPTGVAAVCVVGICRVSKCGDGAIDLRSEDCEVVGTVWADGCDPETCKFRCLANSDCSDGNDCTGEEICNPSEHICQPGTVLVAGSACMMPDTTTGECNTLGVCGPAGCGNNVVGTGEECDDGNTASGDGCENDCTFSCHTNPECEDADLCTYNDVCADTAGGGKMCSAGPPVVCDGGDGCHVTGCDPLVGCVYTLIDADGDGYAPGPAICGGGDCNEADATVHPGAADVCGDGIDNDCNGVVDDGTPTWYVDCDGDGYSAGLVGAVTACIAPAGSSTGCPGGTVSTWTNRRPADLSSTDCYDGNANVHPNELLYHTTAFTGHLPAFDYDCNGTQDAQYVPPSTRLTCLLAPIRGCIGTTHWSATPIPACGATGTLVKCISGPVIGGGCVWKSTSGVQAACR
jgi:cysteine-rich repeat protein